MKLSDFDYELPPRCIAQQPAEPRDSSRLLVHEICADRTTHLRVADLPTLLRAGDLLVVNDTRVRQARLLGVRPGGGAVELLLLERLPQAPNLWRALAQPAKRLRPDDVLQMEGGAIEARCVERRRADDGSLEPTWIVELRDPRAAGADAETLLDRHGRPPLPPYIARPEELAAEQRAEDRARYQTVYAREVGAVAAPTAGLHFTPQLLARLESADIARAAVTLHVGLGTFQPVQVEDPREHRMHAENYVLPAATVAAIASARGRGGRVVAVGTTSARVLESCVGPSGEVTAGAGETRLFLHPGRELRVVDALLTNFHLPRSTLLMLVSALAGRERILRLYAEAIESGYRFYSYGDAMLLLR
ncbi:MAG: tRNA preQ1(34) S-adenosylmethionine ribosyltransferase-isomerase QueA [Planctomycetes bacterium]|nr:tRNA preQ1(34) S-adenosylmethionine ribosyltransferase-isomerase QueA [Planctomycetota bacterium]